MCKLRELHAGSFFWNIRRYDAEKDDGARIDVRPQKIVERKVESHIREAMAAGWDPDSRGKPFVYQGSRIAELIRSEMSGRGFTVNKDWDNPVEHAMPAEARVPAEVRLGTVVVRPATVLAPMAGVTDTVFRRFIRHASLFSARPRKPDGSQMPNERSEDTRF